MTSPTLALEALMLDPAYDEIVQRMRVLTPTAALDQADAATADALSTVTAAARHLGADGVRGALPRDIPDWLRLGVLDAFAGYLTGRADTCRHSPIASSPAPVFAAAWRPGVLSCQACCGYVFRLRAHSDRDATCDSCGHRCAGVDAEDPIFPSLVQLGPLVYQYGTCTDCKPLTVAAPTRDQLQRSRPRGGRGRRRGRGRP
jgi:hypothetical protein